MYMYMYTGSSEGNFSLFCWSSAIVTIHLCHCVHEKEK